MGEQPTGQPDRIGRDPNPWTEGHRALALERLRDRPLIEHEAAICALGERNGHCLGQARGEYRVQRAWPGERHQARAHTQGRPATQQRCAALAPRPG